MLRDGEHELGARPGLAGLDEAQVPGRHADVERQVELTAPPSGPPVAHQRADRLGCHAATVTVGLAARHDPSGHVDMTERVIATDLVRSARWLP